MRKKVIIMLMCFVVLMVGAVSVNAATKQTITTSKTTYNVTVGKTANLGAKAKTTMTYKSSDTKYVTVNSKGVVTAKSPGYATITIKAKSTKKYKAATKTVKVYSLPKISATQKATAKIIFSVMTKKYKLGKVAACAILGNLYVESKLNTDADNNGVGLCKWTASRKVKLMKFAEEKGKPWYDINLQCEFFMSELDNYISLKDFGKENNVVNATEKIMNTYFRPGIKNLQPRIAAALAFYNTL